MNHHPSLALWCGNNERKSFELLGVRSLRLPVQLLLLLAYVYIHDAYPLAKDAYETIWINTTLPVVFQNTHSISYLPSSAGYGYISYNHSASAPYQDRYIEQFLNTSAGTIYGDSG